MHQAKTDLLRMLCTIGTATLAQINNEKNLKDLKGKGTYRLNANAIRVKGLLKLGMIEKLPIDPSFAEKMSRWQYYRPTDKAFDHLDIEKPRTKLKVGENIHHNHGLITCLVCLYKVFGNVSSIEYPGTEESIKLYGFKVDAVITLADGRKFIVEFENNKSFNETVAEIRSKITRFKDKKAKILFILHNTRSADNNSVYPASVIHYQDNPDRNRLNLKFLADLLYEIRDTESHKARFACFYEFKEFDQSIWRAAGKKETFMIQ